MHYTRSHTNICNFFNFSADITPEMLKLCNFIKVNVFFLVLVYVFDLSYLNFRPPFWRWVYYLL